MHNLQSDLCVQIAITYACHPTQFKNAIILLYVPLSQHCDKISKSLFWYTLQMDHLILKIVNCCWVMCKWLAHSYWFICDLILWVNLLKDYYWKLRAHYHKLQCNVDIRTKSISTSDFGPWNHEEEIGCWKYYIFLWAIEKLIKDTNNAVYLIKRRHK